MFVVDTNILVYAAAEVFPKHSAAVRLLKDWRGGRTPWFVTWGILYEFMRVVTHPRVLQNPLDWGEALAFVTSLLASPSLTVLQETQRHREILEDLVRLHPQVSGNKIHDAHTAAIMIEHGIREVRTTDADFRVFHQLTVTNPLE